uniref:Molybdenum cofactor sulfurtransferase n=1 Tax=Tetraselmis sp. GSL018 TaxID=582737 RepID=A0A061S703_9CHLO
MPGPGEWFSLVDAAKACGVKPPDLSRHRADFVVLSFYKIFGYPTGLGAILIHRRAEEILERRYFGGGTVEAVAAEEDFVRRRSGAAGFEDGTPNFLALPALAHGLERIERLGGFPALEAHTHALASHLASWLRAARHGDGAAVAVVYGWGAPPAGRRAASWVRGQGPVVAFNLLRRGGGWVGAREVERLAALRGIRLRTGCFCNPGACQLHLGLSAQDVRRNHAKGHVCWDDNDLVDGRPLGAVRASLGWMSTLDDVLALQRFIEDSFISSEVEDGNSAIVLASPHGLSNSALGTELPRVEEIYVYPVKSLAGFRVGAWPVSSTGLLYDRHWAVLREDGAVLTQKRVAEMALIKPSLDLKRGILTLTSQNMETALHVRISEVPSTGPPSLESDANFSGTNGSSQKCFQCGNNRTVETTFDVSDLGVAAWLTRALGTRCRLAVDTDSGSRKGKDGSRISYANEAQFLFVNKASVDDLNRRVSGRAASAGEPFAPQIRPGRFRPNIVVGGLRPYEEDEWNKIRIGGVLFVSAGPCQRCQMLCIDPSSGLRQGNEPLATLATYRRREGKIVFGRLMTFHGLGGVQGSSRRSEASADAEPEDTSAWPRELVDTGAILRSGSVVEYEPDN